LQTKAASPTLSEWREGMRDDYEQISDKSSMQGCEAGPCFTKMTPLYCCYKHGKDAFRKEASNSLARSSDIIRVLRYPSGAGYRKWEQCSKAIRISKVILRSLLTLNRTGMYSTALSALRLLRQDTFRL